MRGWATGLAVVVLLTAVGTQMRAGAPSYSAIAALWGKSITVRELLTTVSPELLGQLPAAALEAPVSWGDRTTVARWRGETEVEAADAEGDTAGRDVTEIWVSHDNRFVVRGQAVTYGAASTVISPPFMRMDMISVFGFLLEDDTTIDTTGKTRYNVWSLTAVDSYAVDGGAWYLNMSYHYVDHPAGYSPPVVFVVLYSREAWIEE